MSARGRTIAAALVFVTVVLALATLVVASGRTFVPRHPAAVGSPWAGSVPTAADAPATYGLDDKLRLILPDQAYVCDELRAGRFPAWSPLLLGGVPFAANPMTAACYPLTWCLVPFDRLDAPLVSAAAHVLLGGLFVLALLRAFGLGALAAMLGAFGFVFSGWMAAHLQNTPLVAVVIWVPLGLLGIEHVRRGHRRGVVYLTVAVAATWLAGFPQLAVYANLVLGIWAVTAGARRWLLLAGCVLAGSLVAAVQLAPTAELMQFAARRSRTPRDLAAERYRPGAWIGLVAPRFLGDPREPGDWRNGARARAWLGEGPSGAPPQVANWSERTVYPGLVVLVLALLGLGRLRQRSVVLFASTAGLGIALASSADLIGLYARLPGFDFGAPSRAVWLLCFALPALAAHGLHVVVGRYGVRVGTAVVVVAVGDLLAFFVPVNLPVTKAGAFAATPGVRFLQEHLGPARFMRVSADRAAAVADRVSLYHPNQGLLHGVRDAQGYRESSPRWALEVWDDTPALRAPVGITGIAAEDVAAPVLDLLSVRYLVAARPVETLRDHQVYPKTGAAAADWWVYENVDARPRAWFTSEAVPESGVAAPAASGEVRILRDEPARVDVEVRADRAGTLVLADTWFPGWTASLASEHGVQPVAVRRVLTSLRAVPVPAGRHVVRFTYRSWALRLGLGLAALGVGLCLWLTWVTGRRRSPRAVA